MGSTFQSAINHFEELTIGFQLALKFRLRLVLSILALTPFRVMRLQYVPRQNEFVSRVLPFALESEKFVRVQNASKLPVHKDHVPRKFDSV